MLQWGGFILGACIPSKERGEACTSDARWHAVLSEC
jgi:hypothetical protein